MNKQNRKLEKTPSSACGHGVFVVLYLHFYRAPVSTVAVRWCAKLARRWRKGGRDANGALWPRLRFRVKRWLISVQYMYIMHMHWKGSHQTSGAVYLLLGSPAPSTIATPRNTLSRNAIELPNSIPLLADWQNFVLICLPLPGWLVRRGLFPSHLLAQLFLGVRLVLVLPKREFAISLVMFLMVCVCVCGTLVAVGIYYMRSTVAAAAAALAWRKL